MKVFKKDKRDIFLLVCIILSSTLIRFFVSSYDKAMEIYGDELIYYSIAKNLFHHTGIAVHGNSFNIQNIAYSIFLVPFMNISDSVLRIKIITLANALIMSASAFPVWKICEELSLNKKYKWLSVLFTLTCPDMATNATLMSENLFWLITLIAILFIIKLIKTEKYRYSIMAALTSYIAYFCKEAAICLPLALLSYSVIYPLIQKCIFKIKLKKSYEKNFILGLLFYIVTYYLMYVFVKNYFFGGAQNVYQSSLGKISDILHPYTLGYLIYGFTYFVMAFILAFGVFPVLYPLIFYTQLDKLTQKIFAFSFLYLIGSSLMISYTITVKEDFGAPMPRVHLRYIAVFAALFIPLLFRLIQITVDSETSDVLKRKSSLMVLVYGLALLFSFHGPALGPTTEHCSLAYYDMARIRFGVLTPDNSNTYYIYLYAIIVNLLIFFIILAINRCFMYKGKYIPFIIIMLLVNCVNSYAVTKQIRSSQSVDATVIEEMSNINNWFKDNGILQENILYIQSSDPFNKNSKIFDTYFDGTNIIVASSEDIRNQLIFYEDVTNIKEYEFREKIWNGYYYDIENIEYIVVERSELSQIIISDADEVSDVTCNTYVVYRNKDSNKINISIVEPDLEVYFYGDNYNCDQYVSKGISWMEDGYSWTDGKVFSFNALLGSGAPSAQIYIVEKGTYNGDQRYTIISNHEYIKSSITGGAEIIKLDIPLIDGNLSFDMLLPDAVSPREMEGSEDNRELSLRFSKIYVYCS